MAKSEKTQPRQRQRLSRKTKKAIINSVGREQFHDMMAAHSHDSTRKAQAEIFSKTTDQPYLIQSGKLRRLKAFGNQGGSK